jgi:hypothetical protein
MQPGQFEITQAKTTQFGHDGIHAADLKRKFKKTGMSLFQNSSRAWSRPTFNKTQKNGGKTRFFTPGIKRYGWQRLIYVGILRFYGVF